MEVHLRLAGYLNIALGVLGIVACLVALLLFGGPGGILLINARVGSSQPTVEGMVTAAAMIYLLVMAAPWIAVGYGLLSIQEWARNLGMIACILGLIHIPIGTAVGLYSLWVLTSYEIEPLFTSPPGAVPEVPAEPD